MFFLIIIHIIRILLPNDLNINVDWGLIIVIHELGIPLPSMNGTAHVQCRCLPTDGWNMVSASKFQCGSFGTIFLASNDNLDTFQRLDATSPFALVANFQGCAKRTALILFVQWSINSLNQHQIGPNSPHNKMLYHDFRDTMVK